MALILIVILAGIGGWLGFAPSLPRGVRIGGLAVIVLLFLLIGFALLIDRMS